VSERVRVSQCKLVRNSMYTSVERLRVRVSERLLYAVVIVVYSIQLLFVVTNTLLSRSDSNKQQLVYVYEDRFRY
jgi:hypothetical protein